jgi:hypothetical protein
LRLAHDKERDRQRTAARKLQKAELDATRRQEEEAELLGLEVELRMLRADAPDISLLIAVEFVSPDPAHRIALYRLSIADGGARYPVEWNKTILMI